MGRSQKVFVDYDYVFIDTSPAPSILHWLALVASDGAVLPVLPDAKSVDATKTILETCETVKQSQNQDLNVLAVVFNKFVKNSNLARMAKKEITAICRSKKFRLRRQRSGIIRQSEKFIFRTKE